MSHFDTLPRTQQAALVDAARKPLLRTRGGYRADGASTVHTVRCINALERADLVEISQDRRTVNPTDAGYRALPAATLLAVA